MLKTMMAEENAPKRKYFMAPSFDFGFERSNPARMNEEMETSSSDTKTRRRSLAETMNMSPAVEKSISAPKVPAWRVGRAL